MEVNISDGNKIGLGTSKIYFMLGILQASTKYQKGNNFSYELKLSSVDKLLGPEEIAYCERHQSYHTVP